jgi:hypothetical protein
MSNLKRIEKNKFNSLNKAHSAVQRVEEQLKQLNSKTTEAGNDRFIAIAMMNRVIRQMRDRS